MGARDHRLVDDGDRRVRALAARERGLRLGERLAHEQLVVHGPMLADGSGRSVAGRRPARCQSQPQPALERAAAVAMSAAMTAPKRIGILTGGGDVPGLNAVIKSVVYRATELGYDGPRHPPRLGGPDPPAPRPGARPGLPATARPDRTPGRSTGPAARSCTPRGRTRARCATAGAAAVDGRRRTSPLRGRRRPLRPDAARPRQHRATSASTCLVTIGGDDTLSYSQVLVNAGVPLVAIPKTMDNDVQGTEYCIGFSTAITRAKEADQPPADDARQPRADRRLPDLRARRRVLRAVHGVRDLGALRHPRGARTTSTRWPRCWPPTTPRTRATTRSSSPPRARSGRAPR